MASVDHTIVGRAKTLMDLAIDKAATAVTAAETKGFGVSDVPVMALAEIPQGRSSKFLTLGGSHCSGRRVPVAA